MRRCRASQPSETHPLVTMRVSVLLLRNSATGVFIYVVALPTDLPCVQFIHETIPSHMVTSLRAHNSTQATERSSSNGSTLVAACCIVDVRHARNAPASAEQGGSCNLTGVFDLCPNNVWTPLRELGHDHQQATRLLHPTSGDATPAGAHGPGGAKPTGHSVT